MFSKILMFSTFGLYASIGLKLKLLIFLFNHVLVYFAALQNTGTYHLLYGRRLDQINFCIIKYLHVYLQAAWSVALFCEVKTGI